MKTLVFVAAAVAVYFAFSSLEKQHQASVGPLQAPPVEDLAHKLQSAWTDHHTVA